MKNRFLHGASVLCLLAISGRAEAQLVVNYGITVQNLVENVLLGGGVTVSNVTFNGQPAGQSFIQIGSFNGSGCNVGLSQGVFLCTGDIALAVGPNAQPDATLPTGGLGGFGDPDLDATSNSITEDAAILEFDFVPTGDSLNFNYVFGSEEYLEYVGLGYNDVFGFFLSGPGISGPYANGAENIALVPGTATPVAIDNVNTTSNPAYYVDNGDGFTFPNNSSAQYIQFDGFTVPLTAFALVQCGQSYHLKIAIADAGDGLLDSGVFLEGGSFTSPDPLSVEVITEAVNGSLIEGCGDAQLILTRPGSQSTMDISVTVAGTTANGIDHTTIPGLFSLLPGQTSFTFDIEAFADAISEGTEQLTLTFTFSGACGAGTSLNVTIPLEESDLAVDVTSADPVCPDACNGTATSTVSGGNAAYTYTWSDALAGPADPAASSICSGDYALIVQDALGCTAVDSFFVVDPLPMEVDAGADTVLCSGPFNLQATVSNAPAALEWTWTPATGLSDPSVQSPVATISDTVSYTVTVQPVGFPDCAVTDNITITFDPGPDPGQDSLIVICPMLPPFPLISMLGGNPASGGTWTDANGTSFPDDFDPATDPGGIYIYSVASVNGCTSTSTVNIDVLDMDDPLCCGTVQAGPDAVICGLTCSLQATVGNIGSGIWTGPAGQLITPAQSAQATVSAPGPGVVTFTWTEDDGTCLVTDSVTITFTDTLVAGATTTDAVCFGACDGTATAIPAGGTAPFTFLWTGDIANSAQPALEDLCAGELLLNVIDANGCTADASFTIAQPAAQHIDSISFMEPWCYGACDGLISMFDPDAVAFSFNGGATFGPASLLPDACAGTYLLMIQDAAGCMALDSITVGQPPPVVADFIYGPMPATVESSTVNFVNTSQQDVAWLWDIAGLATSQQEDTVFTFSEHAPAVYTVCLTVLDAHGCPDSLCRSVVIEDVLETYVPNCFTPDNDGRNDVWGMVRNIPDIRDFQLSVFDRWGREVFASSDPLARWDGTVEGRIKQDVFVYHISFNSIRTGLPKAYTGHVTVLK